MELNGALRSQLLKGALDLCVLALLSAEAAYAALIVERLAEAGLDGVPEGTIYPALGRLEREGLIVAERVPTRAGPPRKFYRPTPQGEARLGALAAEWTRLDAAIQRLLNPIMPTRMEAQP